MYFARCTRSFLTPDAAEASSSAEVNANQATQAESSESGTDTHKANSSDNQNIDVSTLQSALEEMTQKFNETNDRMYRIAADFENARKRWEKEKSDLRSYCISEFARDLLVVIDAFDKAMTVIEQLSVNVETQEGKHVASIVEGVQLVSKSFADTLKKHGVEKLPGKGEVFNPNFHNAIAKTVDATLQQEMVVDEFMAGYRIGDRILRTAMVRVASPD